MAVLEPRGARPDPFVGRVFAGKYKVLGLLGRGGMGAVYRALQEPVGREVALKVIRGELGDEERARSLKARFVREARIVAKLTNPAVVTLFDHGVEPDGVLYMVMELVKGRRLDQALLADGAFPAARAVAITRAVLRGLSEAHELGLVHRDLKPENLILVKDALGREQVKILDFGVAKVLGPEAGLGGNQTRTGAMIGTPRYMAPEQAAGETVDPRSDLYSLGVVLYEMLAGQALFSGATPFEVLMAHREDPVPPLARDLHVPAAVEAAVQKALEKDVAHRFQAARDMADALERALSAPEEEEDLDDGAPTSSLAGGAFEQNESDTHSSNEVCEGKTVADLSAEVPVERPAKPTALIAPVRAAVRRAKISPVAFALVLAGAVSVVMVAVWLALRTVSAADGPAAAARAREEAQGVAGEAPVKPKPVPPTVVPDEAPTAKAEPAKPTPAKAEPAKAEPAKAEPAKAEPAKAEPAKAEPAKAEPAKAEPAKAEPAKAEPAKAEPAKTPKPKKNDYGIDYF